MDKGHLNPVKINSFSASHVKATFTYTNAVPQDPTWNRGLWAKYEDKIVQYVQKICAGQNGGIMYLMTGTSKFRLKLGPNKQPIQDAIVPVSWEWHSSEKIKCIKHKKQSKNRG